MVERLPPLLGSLILIGIVCWRVWLQSRRYGTRGRRAVSIPELCRKPPRRLGRGTVRAAGRPSDRVGFLARDPQALGCRAFDARDPGGARRGTSDRRARLAGGGSARSRGF